MVSSIDHHYSNKQHLKEVLVRRGLDKDDHANPSLIILQVCIIPQGNTLQHFTTLHCKIDFEFSRQKSTLEFKCNIWANFGAKIQIRHFWLILRTLCLGMDLFKGKNQNFLFLPLELDYLRERLRSERHVRFPAGDAIF